MANATSSVFAFQPQRLGRFAIQVQVNNPGGSTTSARAYVDVLTATTIGLRSSKLACHVACLGF